MADQKRGTSFQDKDSSTKRTKFTDIESKSDNFIRYQSISDEMNGKKESDFDEKLSRDCNNKPQVAAINNPLEDASSQSQEQVSKETSIEADAAEDKGSRHTMEDAWVVLADASLDSPGKLRCAHFAIYDGHGGRLAAEYAQKNLHANVLAAGLPHELVHLFSVPLANKDRTLDTVLKKLANIRWISRWLKRLSSKAFVGLTNLYFKKVLKMSQLLNDVIHSWEFWRLTSKQRVSDRVGADTHPCAAPVVPFMSGINAFPTARSWFSATCGQIIFGGKTGNWQDGATAVCVWILGETVLVANIGDAKAVLARSPSADGSQTMTNEVGSQLKAIVVTREHKAIFPQERVRIQKAGGSVGSNGRLQGRLEVSRAFGDRQFKKVGVIASPDVHSFELTEREHFMILGCDGLWGVFGPSDAVDFVQKQLKVTSSATTAARRLVREAVRERRCKDNCTALVILFKNPGILE